MAVGEPEEKARHEERRDHARDKRRVKKAPGTKGSKLGKNKK